MPSALQNRKRKKAAKAFARVHGITIPKGFAWQPGTIGKPARTLVRSIERFAWPKLAPTGEFNTRVLALLFPPRPIGVRALEIAGGELGVKENPANSNSGPRVRVYQNTTNPGQTGFPWCASFATWALRGAGWKVKFANQAYVPAWVALAHAGKSGLTVVSRHDVQEGDIVTFDWNNDNVADHIGFVRSRPDAVGKFKSREGNTSASSNSNGGEVQDRDRNVSDVCCFIRVKG